MSSTLIRHGSAKLDLITAYWEASNAFAEGEDVELSSLEFRSRRI